MTLKFQKRSPHLCALRTAENSSVSTLFQLVHNPCSKLWPLVLLVAFTFQFQRKMTSLYDDARTVIVEKNLHILWIQRTRLASGRQYRLERITKMHKLYVGVAPPRVTIRDTQISFIRRHPSGSKECLRIFQRSLDDSQLSSALFSHVL